MHPRFPTSPRVLLAVLVTLIASAVVAAPAAAQYFGRNKVLWEDHDFHVLQTQHFDIYYYPEDNPLIDEAARMAERWYERLSPTFGHRFAERKPIILYANHADFQQTTITGGLIGEGTGGFTEALKNRVVMPFTAVNAETDHVLGHELVHAFQYDIQNHLARAGQAGRGLQRLPLWMIEGLAEYLSQGREDPQTAMWVRDAVLHDHLPARRDLERDPRFSPYQFGQAFWAWVGGRWGDATVIRLYVTANVLGVEEAIEQVLGSEADAVFDAWAATIRDDYGPILAARRPVTEVATRILDERAGRSLDIAPALSPDGRWLAFLSTRDLLSIDLFLADARSGEVIDRLVSARRDPHFDALRFVESAGGWSPDSRRLAFAVVERGDNRLAIVDVESRRVERRIPIPGVEALESPTWSPDGRYLAFSGMAHSVSDLYLYDLETERTLRLTDDPYSDIQPAWSPDGRHLVFVTDRGADTDFGSLDFAPLRLATLEVGDPEAAGRGITVLDLMPGAKLRNPQFSPDGASLYFIADPEGIADVFRYDVATGAVEAVTRVQTGVTGITDLSPALSVAADSGEIAISVLDDGGWTIYRLGVAGAAPAPVAAAGASAVAAGDLRRAAFLPPIEAVADAPLVTAYLERPALGLPRREIPEERVEYDPNISLDYLGPVAGVGFDQYGLGLGGSVTAYWSDILGRHQIGGTLIGGSTGGSDLSSSLGGQLFYLNRANRIQWGIGGAHIPYTSASTRVGSTVVEIDGQPVRADVIEQLRQEVLIDEVSLLGAYPFSLNRRLEAEIGYTHYGFDAELERVLAIGNNVLDRETTQISAQPSFDYSQASLAYVGDSSFFGIASPIAGSRYRLEVESTFGDLQFETGLADYRRYFWRRPVTLAVRGLFFGRFGDDAEDPRLTPLNVGRATLVRGYDVDSFELSECTRPEGSTACPEFDRLLGSRMAVAGAELRVPLFGSEEYGLFELPFLPTELLAFVDLGVAWTEDESPELDFVEDSVERVPVASAGVGLRVLLGGYIPIQVYYAHPFQRPQEDGVFGFLIASGF